MSSWFEQLFGVQEPRTYAYAQALFASSPPILKAVVAGERFGIGHFSTPTLASLRANGLRALVRGGVRVRHIAVQSALEAHAQHPGATFQAASQFNCLEFVTPDVVPEDGVTEYADDRTQGPDCALACAAGTVYRNYFVPVPTSNGFQVGQSADAQLNTLSSLERAVLNHRHGYWHVHNGYVTLGHGGEHALAALGSHLTMATDAERDALLGHVAVGVHEDVQITYASRWDRAPLGLTCTQVYCSAISLGGYSNGVAQRLWAPLACLVLDAAYEATLWAAVLAAQRTGVHDVFLTFVGGGVFGNDMAWIAHAIGRAVRCLDAAGASLNVYICHYRHVDERMRRLVDMSCLQRV